jgi:hypothetical protein
MKKTREDRSSLFAYFEGPPDLVRHKYIEDEEANEVLKTHDEESSTSSTNHRQLTTAH